MLTKKDSVINLLNEYIEDNADYLVVQRAYSIYPFLIREKNHSFFFECQGSQLYPYDCFIDISNYSRIQTSCSCPYNGFGICKHVVASFHHLIQLIDEEIFDVNAPKKTIKFKSNSTTIPHDKGVIDTVELNKMNFRSGSYYYSPLRITAINKHTIEGFYDNYREAFDLKLSFQSKTNQILLNCSCKSPYPCGHKGLFLREIVKRFGPNYFADDYIERIKKQKLESAGFDPSLGFDDLFTLNITTDGVAVKEKVKNIFNKNQVKSLFGTEANHTFYLPNTSEDSSNYGVTICFEKQGNSILNVFPMYGKLNKAQTKISTKFREIDAYDFVDILPLFDNKSDKDLIISGVQLASQYAQVDSQTIDIESVKSLVYQFKDLVSHEISFPFVVWNNRKSMINKNLTPLSFKKEEVVPVLKISDKKPFYQLDFKVKFDKQTYGVNSKQILLTPLGVIKDEVLYPIHNPETAYHLMKTKEKSRINVINKGIEQLKTDVIAPFSKVFEIDFKGIKASKPTTKQKKENVEKHVYLSDENGEYIVIHPVVKYGKSLISPESMEKVWKSEKKLTYLERNKELEADFITEIRTLHPRFEQQTKYYHLTTDEALSGFWLMQAIDQLKEKDIRVFGLNDLKTIKYNLNKPSFSMGLSSGTDWFDMEIDIAFGDQKVDLKQLQKSIVKKSNYVELKDGTIGILPKEWIEKYKKYFKLGQVKKDKIEISNFQFNIIDELYEEETNAPKFLEELHQKKQRLLNLKELKDVPTPKGIEATLRDYQKEGLNWMVFLHENKLGGCLADDMGLGKTLQTIAFFQYLKNLPKKDRSPLPHLVIAPTSLMFNWQAEIEKFAPKMKVLPFIGANRHEFQKEIGKNDIILTTYGSMIKDIEMHKDLQYNYVVLDESQAIKNPQSQRFKAVRLLKANNRLALTGTPIENNTFDLYSQFSFLNPGIFGSIKHFKSTFAEAIDKGQDEYSSELLSRMIHPFLLRRTKLQVAKELPSKTESVIYCEMGKKQRKVYEDYKLYFRQKLQEQIEEEGINKSQMYILQGLTKLRQICNSTALADKEKDQGNDSTKLDELVRHLTEKVNNHKILVFSQFVGMLNLVKARLEQEAIIFEYLDGQTRNREEKVNNFQNNDKTRVFLISLKAGGTGLNLTGADYVYLIDPWWNPAVESQAIDRCYRIGQDKKVMAYRMICKDTIEEKIVQLQDKKKTVAADVIRVDKEKKSFDKGDVEMFFGMS